MTRALLVAAGTAAATLGCGGLLGPPVPGLEDGPVCLDREGTRRASLASAPDGFVFTEWNRAEGGWDLVRVAYEGLSAEVVASGVAERAALGPAGEVVFLRRDALSADAAADLRVQVERAWMGLDFVPSERGSLHVRAPGSAGPVQLSAADHDVSSFAIGPDGTVWYAAREGEGGTLYRVRPGGAAEAAGPASGVVAAADGGVVVRSGGLVWTDGTDRRPLQEGGPGSVVVHDGHAFFTLGDSVWRVPAAGGDAWPVEGLGEGAGLAPGEGPPVAVERQEGRSVLSTLAPAAEPFATVEGVLVAEAFHVGGAAVVALVVQDTTGDGRFVAWEGGGSLGADEIDVCLLASADGGAVPLDTRSVPKRHAGREADLAAFAAEPPIGGGRARFERDGTLLVIEAKADGPGDADVTLAWLRSARDRAASLLGEERAGLRVEWPGSGVVAAREWEEALGGFGSVFGAGRDRYVDPADHAFEVDPTVVRVSEYEWSAPIGARCTGTVRNLTTAPQRVVVACTAASGFGPELKTVRGEQSLELPPGRSGSYGVWLEAGGYDPWRFDLELRQDGALRRFVNRFAQKDAADWLTVLAAVRKETGLVPVPSRTLFGDERGHDDHFAAPPGFGERPEKEQRDLAKRAHRLVLAHASRVHDDPYATLWLVEPGEGGRRWLVTEDGLELQAR